MVKWTEYTDRAKSNRIPQQIEPRLETASLLDPVSSYKTNDNLICAPQKLNFAIMRLMRRSLSAADLATPFRARTTAGGMARSRGASVVFPDFASHNGNGLKTSLGVYGVALFRLDDF